MNSVCLIKCHLFLPRVHSKGSVICKMTLNFAAEPLNKNEDLLKDLQDKVASGKVGHFSVDQAHTLNVEPDVGKIHIYSLILFLLQAY